MSKDIMVVGPDQMPDWLEKRRSIMGEIEAQLIRGLCEPGKGLTLEQLQVVVEHRNPFEVASDPALFFNRFYRDFCGLEVDFSNVKIPELQRDFTRILGIPQGLTPNRMFEALEKHFPCWRYTRDLDRVTMGLNEREPTESYFIRVRNRQEADEELKNKSANDIKERNLKTETLLERLVHEGVWYFETGDHLDIQNVTLCSGSRGHGGSVLRADWGRDRFKVRWYDPDYPLDDLRAREAVS